MKKPCLYILTVLLVGIGFSAQAQEMEQQEESPYQQYSKAVAIGARIDAYGAYCELETQLGSVLREKAKKEGVQEPEDESLQIIQETVYEESMKELQERNVECKDIGFLLEKLDLMKMLKETTNSINGEDSEEVIETTPADPL
ncbi:MAG: hypothetical protein DHS20C02_07740 [Micavibrio sp.]|nr:MAG: hypothetical protein DHS20C02_07740 [Micavibrio sp.]